MKILVFAHRFEVGGTQRNAVDLSTSLRDIFNHEIVIFATPGPMVQVAKEKGLRFIPAPSTESIPSLAMIRALREVVRSERPDLVHVWDWWQCVDAYYAVHLLHGIPMIVSDMMSDRVTRLLPKSLLTTFGTPEFVDASRAMGRKRTELLVPPVDVRLNAPNILDTGRFREQYKIKSNDVVLVTVSRLVADLKGESLRQTIDAVRELGRELPLCLVMVGDGNARAELERLADEANAALGRLAVILTGELVDPRPAYAAADIVVGMGGSALRGAAFGKPVIIVGAKGFSALLSPQTAESFFYRGIYGIGDGTTGRLAAEIRALVEAREKLPVLGAFSRHFVVEHFALEKVAAQLEGFCHAAVAGRRRIFVAAADGLRTAALLRLGRFLPASIRHLIKNREAHMSPAASPRPETSAARHASRSNRVV